MKRLLFAAILGLLVWPALNARADFVAYVVPSGVIGNQIDAATGSFGMDFNVNSAITITQLGVFDSNQDGLIAPIQVAIYDRSNGSLVSPVETFAAGNGAGSGTLVGGSRFLAIAPITLAAGFQGSVIVFGYGNGITAETDGNSYAAATGTPTYPWTTDSGGGSLSFVGAGRFNNGGPNIVFPTIIDSGPANRYAAGTFAFRNVPEPSSFALLGGSAALLLVGAWRRRAKASASRA